MRVDFAAAAGCGAWLHHPVYGDPSFDTFERMPGNPIHRGRAPLEWPVNGFLFEDPLSGAWFIYVGHYPEGYAAGPDKPSCVCTVFRSKDQGKSWEHLGPVFSPGPFTYEGDASPVGGAPDVSVAYRDGRYHMAFDWATTNATWETLHDPKGRKGGADAGVGYAWAERPEGPFYRTAHPIIRNSRQPAAAFFGKYRRLYASTLIPRRRDWLMLTLVDSGPWFAWGLCGSTATSPEGPYSDPVILLHVDGDRYQPPLLEYFPAFTHEEWIYAPATSVAANRDFQLLHRAPIEAAMDPSAWEIAQSGSVWHAEPVENEAHGIWGQTFSGFVGRSGRLHVMFPSRDEQGLGTINLASRPWAEPLRARGFRMSGHRAPSYTCLRQAYESFRLRAEFTLRGRLTLLWSHRAPLGPNVARSDATLHAKSLASYSGVEVEAGRWRVVSLHGGGGRTVLAEGDALAESAGRWMVEIDRRDGRWVALVVNGRSVWSGEHPVFPGRIGLWLDRRSHLEVERFEVEGRARDGVLPLLCAEALLGAGQNMAEWTLTESAMFRHGLGAVHKAPGGRAKWNFAGTGFTLWSPKGPDWGRVEVLLDGETAGAADLCAPTETASAPVFSTHGLPDGLHAVVVRGGDRPLVVDSLDAHTAVPTSA